MGYSRAVVQGDWCFVSGTTGYDYKTMAMPEDPAEQTRNCFATIRGALEGAGFVMADIVRVQYTVTDAALVEAIAPVFGGVNLEDISAPRCFEIEQRLRERLDIPVFHDDQHGTAIVVLSALLNALRVVGKRIEDVRVVTTGCGAAGMAVTRTLQHAGVRWIVGCDEGGALYRGRASTSVMSSGCSAPPIQSSTAAVTCSELRASGRGAFSFTSSTRPCSPNESGACATRA